MHRLGQLWRLAQFAWHLLALRLAVLHVAVLPKPVAAHNSSPHWPFVMASVGASEPGVLRTCHAAQHGCVVERSSVSLCCAGPAAGK